MAAIAVDLTGLPRGVRESLRRRVSDENAAKLTMALQNQKRLARLYAARGSAGGSGTIGPLDTVVDPYLQAYFSRVCAAKELVWDDPEFVAWLKKNEPAVAVRHGTRKIQVGYR